MATPHPSDYNSDAALVGWAIHYSLHAEQHFADKMFPPILMDKEAGEYKVVDVEDFFRVGLQEVPDGEPTPIVTQSFKAETYQTRVVGGRTQVTRRAMNNANKTGIDPTRMAMMKIMKEAMLKRDMDFASTFFPTGTTALWGTGDNYTKNLATAEKWDATPTPGNVMTLVKDIRSRVQSKSGDMINRMLIGRKAFDRLTEHPELLDKIKHTQKGVITRELVAQLFEIDEVIIADAPYNDAVEGAPRSIKRHGDTSALFAYVNAGMPSDDGASAGYCLEALDEGVEGIPGAGGFMVRSWYDNERSCFFYEVKMNYVYKIIDNNRSFMLTDIVAL